MTKAPSVTAILRWPGTIRQQQEIYKAVSKLFKGDGLLYAREPKNPYDGNAIRLFDTSNNSVGYADRVSASVLAPYIDTGWLYTVTVTKEPEFNFRRRTQEGFPKIIWDSVTVKFEPIHAPLKGEKKKQEKTIKAPERVFL